VPSCKTYDFGYLEEVAGQGKLALISTGISTEQNIQAICDTFDYHRCPYVISHCVSKYPPKTCELNLNYIDVLKNQLDYVGERHLKAVGYSSHDAGVVGSIVAIAKGATYIEKHFTMDRKAYGADQKISLNVKQMKRFVRLLRLAEEELGATEKTLYGDEKIPVLTKGE
jgi:N-acetylneuraminate synthase